MSAMAWCSRKRARGCMVNGLRASEQRDLDSLRSSGELPHCLASLSARTQTQTQHVLAQNQRGQLARVQIVVVDRRTPSALRKEHAAARADLSIRSATRCQQGLSQLRVKDSMIKNGALRRHTATLCSDTRRLSLRLPVSRYFGAYLRQQSTVNNPHVTVDSDAAEW
jgi:hypothetical protein